MAQDDIKKTVEDLKKIVQRDLPADDRGVLEGVISSLEEFLKVPYDEDQGPHKPKQHYHAVYRRKIPGRGR